MLITKTINLLKFEIYYSFIDGPLWSHKLDQVIWWLNASVDSVSFFFLVDSGLNWFRLIDCHELLYYIQKRLSNILFYISKITSILAAFINLSSFFSFNVNLIPLIKNTKCLYSFEIQFNRSFVILGMVFSDFVSCKNWICFIFVWSDLHDHQSWLR